METKLTLKIDSNVISKAKKYIEVHKGTSLSKLVENYFNALTIDKKEKQIGESSPIVASLAGIAKELDLGKYEEEYTEYLTAKYK